MENEKIEIAEICGELKTLAHSGILREQTAEACTQAASLLSQIREVILAGLSENWHTPGPSATAEIVDKLKWILVKQGEG